MDNEKYIEIEKTLEDKKNIIKDVISKINISTKNIYESTNNLNYFIQSHFENVDNKLKEMKEEKSIIRDYLDDNKNINKRDYESIKRIIEKGQDVQKDNFKLYLELNTKINLDHDEEDIGLYIKSIEESYINIIKVIKENLMSLEKNLI